MGGEKYRSNEFLAGAGGAPARGGAKPKLARRRFWDIIYCQ